MNYSSNDEARLWAENLAASEGEAFEQALKRIKPDDVIQRLTAENAEPRDTIKIQASRYAGSESVLQETMRTSMSEVI